MPLRDGDVGPIPVPPPGGYPRGWRQDVCSWLDRYALRHSRGLVVGIARARSVSPAAHRDRLESSVGFAVSQLRRRFQESPHQLEWWTNEPSVIERQIWRWLVRTGGHEYLRQVREDGPLEVGLEAVVEAGADDYHQDEALAAIVEALQPELAKVPLAILTRYFSGDSRGDIATKLDLRPDEVAAELVRLQKRLGPDFFAIAERLGMRVPDPGADPTLREDLTTWMLFEELFLPPARSDGWTCRENAFLVAARTCYRLAEGPPSFDDVATGLLAFTKGRQRSAAALEKQWGRLQLEHPWVQRLTG